MSIVALLISLAAAPLLIGVVSRVKAVVAGRRGPPLLQQYIDIAKCLRKGAVYSGTAGFAVRAGPIVGLSAILTALLLVPIAGARAPLAFEGDLILLGGLLALARFFTIVAALDTGSAFEGMGASREAQWSVLTEPAFLLSLAALARLAGTLSLSEISAALSAGVVTRGGIGLLLAISAMALVFLAENARLPFDDPATHLELTMIHEVMVLDHGGPDLGLILYASSLKLWLLGSVMVGMLLPRSGSPAIDLAASLGGMAAVGVATGLVESASARLRLQRVPQLLLAACIMAALALLLVAVR